MKGAWKILGMEHLGYGVYALTKVAHQLAVHSQRQQPGLAAVWVDTKKKVSDGLVMGAVPADASPAVKGFLLLLQAEHGHGLSSILTGDKETLYISLTLTTRSERAFLLLWQSSWSLGRTPGGGS